MNEWKVEVVNPITDDEKKYLVNLVNEFLNTIAGKIKKGEREHE